MRYLKGVLATRDPAPVRAPTLHTVAVQLGDGMVTIDLYRTPRQIRELKEEGIIGVT